MVGLVVDASGERFVLESAGLSNPNSIAGDRALRVSDSNFVPRRLLGGSMRDRRARQAPRQAARGAACRHVPHMRQDHPAVH
jgi:hypothetical protein